MTRGARGVGFIEIEVESKNEAIIVAETFQNISKQSKINIPFIIMLDNFKPSEIKNTIQILNKKSIRNNITIEASGGINSSNIKEYAKTGVDIISLGYLTHSVKAVDLSMEIELLS